MDDGLETSALLVCVARLGCNSTDDTIRSGEARPIRSTRKEEALAAQAQGGQKRRSTRLLQIAKEAQPALQSNADIPRHFAHRAAVGAALVEEDGRSTVARSGAPPLSLAESHRARRKWGPCAHNT